MLNLALVALMSGSLLTAAPDGDCDKNKTDCESTQAAVAEEAIPAPPDERSLTSDTYAFGRPSDAAPIKLWVEYGYGEVQNVYLPNGEEATDLSIGGTDGDITSQRLSVGAQINVINFPAFKFGVGGQLNVAQNKFQAGSGAGGPFTGGLESSFGLQGVKIYGTARGRVVGIHGGYFLDLGSEQQFAAGVPTDLPNSDGRDAIFFGGDFDYPSEHFRLFGGIDYFMKQDGDVPNPATGGMIETVTTNDDVILFNMGAGVRFGFFELGAALLLRTQLEEGFVSSASGSHSGTIAPYLKLSPPSLPVSLFVRGAVLNEYTDYGYTLGGGNDIKPGLGFTGGLTIGFD